MHNKYIYIFHQCLGRPKFNSRSCYTHGSWYLLAYPYKVRIKGKFEQNFNYKRNLKKKILFLCTINTPTPSRFPRFLFFFFFSSSLIWLSLKPCFVRKNKINLQFFNMFFRNLKKKKVPASFELATFCVLSRRDNHYTTEPSCFDKNVNLLV